MVQDWKKSHHLSSHYTKKALSLYESFLRPNGTRFIGLAIDDELIKAFEVYKEKEFDGLWKEGKDISNILSQNYISNLSNISL